jgi:hypothetical protein
LFRIVTDENLHGGIFNRLKTHLPDLDIVRVQDIKVAGKDDETVLEWAASEQRILLTHDKRTIVPIYSNRQTIGQLVPSVFMISTRARHDLILEDLLLIFSTSEADEWTDRITYIPL